MAWRSHTNAISHIFLVYSWHKYMNAMGIHTETRRRNCLHLCNARRRPCIDRDDVVMCVAYIQKCTHSSGKCCTYIYRTHNMFIALTYGCCCFEMNAAHTQSRARTQTNERMSIQAMARQH